MSARASALSFFLLFFNYIFAQDNKLLIQGAVFAEDGQPVPYASISLVKDGLGTITNQSGRFALYIPAVPKDDHILVTMLGYEPQLVLLNAFKPASALRITLKLQASQLEEVVVTPPDPLQLIRNAIARIPQNYYNQPHVLNGFYRVDTRKGQQHIMLSEAVFDIYNPDYTSGKKSRFRLTKMRSIQDEQASHGLDLGLTPASLYTYDIVKELESSDLLSREGLKQHDFKFKGITNYNGIDACLITFDQKDELKQSLLKGKLWLDAGSLAFIAFEFQRSPKGIDRAQYGNGATRALLKILGLQIDVKKETHLIRYKKYGGKWILSDVRNDHILHFKSNRNGKRINFDADIRVDYLVTAADTLHAGDFTAGEKLGNNKFIEFQPNSYNDTFWLNYNTILPDFNTNEIAKQIQQNNQTFVLKKKAKKFLSKLPSSPVVKLDSLFSFFHTQGAFSGSVLVKQKGAVIFQKGYGLADEGKQWPNADSTRFRIGSLTKTFTSMMIRQLEQEGELSLQDSIGKFFPAHVHGSVSIEQLLTHTSGIPNYTVKDEYLAELLSRPLNTEYIIRNFCSDPLEFRTGTGFRYSNSGYVILSGIIEKATGQSFAACLQEKIFAPLHMNSSGFSNAPLNSKGYWLDEIEPAYPVSNTVGAGGIWTTTGDLEKWDEALYGNKLLSQKKIQESFQEYSDYDDWDAGYGYGWMIDRLLFSQSKEHRIIYHPGTDFGYYSMFVRQPDQQHLLVMLSNHGDFPRFELTDLVLDILNP
ncbi:serine hydrolase [Pseudoflavitalea rhizosphaerae]|uniref:serine hydrolase n=1 Tax=Pseudoflavitalea rhizosphaerae TaxID=1884793 RepID=UPI000F8DF143|nr:serine hydrolase [Pseudoflavitalea rhizosphaerae]